MSYLGRISIVIIYITIVLGWHSFYFLIDYEGSYVFMIENGQYKWDLLFIPLLSPFFWWLGLQYDKAKFLSQKDALTGLYNRRFISQSAPKLLAKMDKKIGELTISVIDCDNFKQINDKYGHKLGDLVLTKITEVLLTSTSEQDIVARWGGDEFLIVSPYSDQKRTRAITKKIESGLYQLSNEMGMDISVSIGTAVYPSDACEMKELLIIADRNMYKRKSGVKTQKQG
ncbi:GGDEF domain-containing protein [Neobacillus rhizosphaerae]|uniref:GGDEF domain-containing protein n=1 Tax=Neobacillus rhizosphaerae TaxID=2880965 RepID=UPI003D2BAC7D